ncbi:MAG: tetratricopeptide repeat protein [Candidatus Gastranaerophilales bacterium]|nr:tetratricopeptide repeat protein [Candidatus Gastranaerophilales bacterium]
MNIFDVVKFKNKFLNLSEMDYQILWLKFLDLLDTPIFFASFDELYEKGLDLYNEKKYFLASKCFAKAYYIRPNDLDTLYNYALNLQLSMEYNEAINYYLKYLKLDSQNPDVHYNIALCYENNRNYEKAVEHFEKALSFREDVATYISLSYVLAHLKKFERAIEFILKTVNPKDYSTLESLLNLGSTFEQKYNEQLNTNLDYLEFAIEIYKKILIFDESSYEANYRIMECYKKLKNFEEAKKYCLNALKSFPSSFEANYNMGILLYLMNKPEKAAYYFELAIKIEPKQTAEVYLNLSLIFETLHREDEAIKILKEALNNIENKQELETVKKNLRRLLKF